MNREQLSGWLARYGRAWETRDASAAGELFTSDAQYHRTPFDTIDGRRAIEAYWERATADQSDVGVTTAVVAVEGDLGVGRFVADYADASGNEVRLDGLCLVELADDGVRCCSFREWWHRTRTEAQG